MPSATVAECVVLSPEQAEALLSQLTTENGWPGTNPQSKPTPMRRVVRWVGLIIAVFSAAVLIQSVVTQRIDAVFIPGIVFLLTLIALGVYLWATPTGRDRPK